MTAADLMLLGAGLALDLVLALLPLLAWRFWGRDPRYTDDDSVLMPGPPPDFTPALATIVLDGVPSRRTVSAGLMHLVSRDLIAFRPEPAPVGHRVSIELTTHSPRHLHLPAPETNLYQAIREKVALMGLPVHRGPESGL